MKPAILLTIVFVQTLAERLVHIYQDFQSNHHPNEIDYSFRYYVDSPSPNRFYNVIMDHWEARKNDYTRGGYSLVDPEGNVRSVLYEVDHDSGFRAQIRTRTPGSVQFQNIYSRASKLKQPQIPYRHSEPIAYVLK